MTDELMALADRAEALTGPCRETDALIAVASGLYVREKRGNDRQEWFYPVSGSKYNRAALYYGSTGRVLERYTASLDAAMTLVPEGWAIEGLSFWPAAPDEADSKTQPRATARLVGTSVKRMGRSMVWGHSGGDGRAEATAATPALALTAAALRARATKEPEA